MPVNNNLKINFNTPVIFDKEVLKNKKPIEKALISIGQVADEYLHIGNKYLKVNATKIESVSIKSPVLKSVFKVFSYILSIGLLPAIASIAKAVYKNWAQKQSLPEQKLPNDKVNQEMPTASEPSSRPTSTSTEPSNPYTNKEDPIKKEDSTKSETELPQSSHTEEEDVDTETSPEAKDFYKQTKNGRIATREAKASLGHVKWQKSTSAKNLSKTHSSNDLQKQIDELLNELQSENNTSDDTTIVKKLLQIRQLMPKNSSTDYALNTVNANLLKSIATPPPVENKEEIYNKDGLVAIKTRIIGGIPAKWQGLDELTYQCISYILTENQKDLKFLQKFNNDEKKALLNIMTRKKEEAKLNKKGQRPTPIARTESKKFVYLNLNQFRSTNTSSSLSTVDEDSEGSGTFKFKGKIDSSMTSDEESEETGTVKYNEKTVASQKANNNLSSEEDSSDEDSFIINEGVEDRPFNHQFTQDGENSSGEDIDEDNRSSGTFIEKT